MFFKGPKISKYGIKLSAMFLSENRHDMMKFKNVFIDIFKTILRCTLKKN